MAAKWTKAASIIWEELDGGALLIDSKTGARWSLNATAAALWSWCDGTCSLNELAARLARASQRTLREARAEVREFCARIAAQNLLTPAAATRGLTQSTLPFSTLSAPAKIHALGLGHGPRSRPGPRGNSSPG